MKKKIGTVLIQLFVFVINIFLVMATFQCSFLLRYGTEIPVGCLVAYKENSLFLTFIFMLSLAFTRVFKNRHVSYWELLCRIICGLCLGIMFGFMYFYILRTKWMGFPSGIFAVILPVGLFIIGSVDTIILKLTGRINKRVIVIGNDKDVTALEHFGPLKIIYVKEIEDILEHEDIDEIIVCKQLHDEKKMNLLFYLLTRLDIRVVFSPLLYSELLSWNIIENNSIKHLATFIGQKSDFEEFIIRALDIFVSIIVLTFLSPLLLIVSLLVTLTSKGAVLYKQQRISKDGKVFTLYKFRTMIQNAELNTGPILASRADPRVTKLGKILRTTRFDEIPQLINILLGQMSLVGPRPERPHFVKHHKVLREIRLAVKPGLTGLAQIRSMYDLHPKHKIKYDYLYIQNRSLLLNIYIMLKTIPVLFSKKGW